MAGLGHTVLTYTEQRACWECGKVEAFPPVSRELCDQRFLDHNLLICTMKWGFTGGSAVKNPPTNAGDTGLILELGRSSGEGHDNPLQYSFLKSHGQRSLVGCSPWGRKESDMTE